MRITYMLLAFACLLLVMNIITIIICGLRDVRNPSESSSKRANEDKLAMVEILKESSEKKSRKLCQIFLET